MPRKRSPKFAKSVDEAAVLLGRTKASLQTWGMTSGCPCRREHKIIEVGYDLDRIRRWAEANGYSVDKETGRIHGDRRDHQPATIDDLEGKPSVALVFKTAQAEEKRAKAALVQLELKMRENAVHSVDDCQDRLRKLHLYMIRELRMWARSLGPTLAGLTALEIQAKMTDKVEDLMRVFSGETES